GGLHARRVSGFEPVVGHQEQGSINVAATKRANVAVKLGVPGAVLYLVGDVLTLTLEQSGGNAGDAVLFTEREKAIEGGPTKHARVGVILRTLARLPDALVRFIPVVSDV